MFENPGLESLEARPREGYFIYVNNSINAPTRARTLAQHTLTQHTHGHTHTRTCAEVYLEDATTSAWMTRIIGTTHKVRLDPSAVSAFQVGARELGKRSGLL